MFRQPHSKRLEGRIGTVAFLALGLAVLTGPDRADAQDALNIATWGGAYGRAQEIAVFEPFVKETGTVIATEIYDGKLSRLKDLIAADDTPVDVVDVSAGTLAALCREGLLEKIDPAALRASTDGDDFEADFYPGALSDCGVASLAWATALAFDREAFPDGQPTSLGALLDPGRFPGKRALPDTPQRTLELVLLADGVADTEVYTTLDTPEGAERAFAALDKIKDDVLLWSRADQPMTWLAEGKAAMAAGYSGRVFRAAAGDRKIGILWDGQIYDLDAWAIPKTAGNKEEAMRFIRFATAPAQLAAQARLTAYGPMRKSALPLVGNHPILGSEMLTFLPTAPGNFENALKFDGSWWEERGSALNQRFARWVAEVRTAEAEREAARKAKEAAETNDEDNDAP